VLPYTFCQEVRAGSRQRARAAAQVAGLAGRRWTVNPYLSVVLGVSASVLLCALLWFVRRFLCRMRPGAPVVRRPAACRRASALANFAAPRERWVASAPRMGGQSRKLPMLFACNQSAATCQAKRSNGLSATGQQRCQARPA